MHAPVKGTLRLAVVAVLLGPFFAPASYAYSVLTHEAIIDSVWDKEIKALLLLRFPGATEEELRNAHAHAYGGCIIQDMGYYPSGNKFFSDLVHYSRSGDFATGADRGIAGHQRIRFCAGRARA